MKKIAIALAAMLAGACTQAPPEMQLVNAAAAALGGRDKILTVKTLTIEGEGTNPNLGQNPTPEADLQVWKVTGFKRTIDLVDGTTFRARTMPSPEGPISSFYESHGYAIFRGAIERASIDALHAALDTEVIASNGAFLRHKSLQRDPNIFLAGTSIPADGLLDPHAQSETPRTAAAIESLLLTDRIADLLTSIDGAQNYTVHQTIVFFTPPGTGLHLDGWSLDTDPRGFGHTLWIPFEPVTLSNGPLAIVPWPRGKVGRAGSAAGSCSSAAPAWPRGSSAA